MSMQSQDDVMAQSRSSDDNNTAPSGGTDSPNTGSGGSGDNTVGRLAQFFNNKNLSAVKKKRKRS